MKTLIALMLTLSFGAFAGESMAVKCDKQFDGAIVKDYSSTSSDTSGSKTTKQ